jgi:tetratricopeptide (TPR) repeat protein
MSGQDELLHHAATFHDAGRYAEAEELYLRILAAEPMHPDANYNLGLLALHFGRAELGLPYLQAAWKADPLVRQYWQALAECLLALVRFEEVLSLTGVAVKHGMQTPQLLRLSFFAQRGLDRTPPPDDVAEEVLALFRSGRNAELEQRLRPLLAEYPGWGLGWKTMGAIMLYAGRDAEEMLRRVVALAPQDAEAYKNLGVALLDSGKIVDAVACYRKSMEIEPQGADVYSNLLFCLSHDESIGAEEIFREHCKYGDRFETPLRGEWGGHPNTPEPERPLHVGFVSADLYNHAVANFIEPIVRHMASNPGFVLHAYLNRVVEDDVTVRLKSYFARWDMVVGLSDEALARKVRVDRIDILVDLSGHTGYNRLLTFARKPAPVQASWIGYAGTTGLRAMDYYIADRFFLPKGMFDNYFTEKIARLSACVPFLPSEYALPVKDLPALGNGYITFGSFNRLSKISHAVVVLWSRLLRELPDSRMLLGGMPVDGGYEKLIEWFAQEGIASDRLELHPRSGMDVYLGLHQRVDICLDTFPYNGGTTTFHALWMGVPTLTLVGETPAARSGASILGQVGLDEFVVQDAADFVVRGKYWAGHLAELSELRAGLRKRFAQSPAGQPKVVAENIERALRAMWRRWCAGLPPESFGVDSRDSIDVVVESV